MKYASNLSRIAASTCRNGNDPFLTFYGNIDQYVKESRTRLVKRTFSPNLFSHTNGLLHICIPDVTRSDPPRHSNPSILSCSLNQSHSFKKNTNEINFKIFHAALVHYIF